MVYKGQVKTHTSTFTTGRITLFAPTHIPLVPQSCELQGINIHSAHAHTHSDSGSQMLQLEQLGFQH